MSAELKVGLVGCGGISAAHARAYRALPGIVRVTAVCDSVGERARNRASQLGAEQVYTSLEEFLAHSGVDAVDLCLPHHLHAAVAVTAARGGKHVLVEKPIATSLVEADAMIAAADAARVKLMVGHNQRYAPEYQAIRRLLDDGEIGDVVCARTDHTQNFQRAGDHWSKGNDTAGGGVIINSGIHRVDLLRWLVGEIVEVANFQVVQPERLQGEAAAVTIFKFAGGAIGEMVANWAARRSPWFEMLQLTGERGMIYNLGGVYLDSDRRPEGQGEFLTIPVPEADSFVEEIRHFATCVLDDREPLTNGREGRASLAVCLAAYRSAASP